MRSGINVVEDIEEDCVVPEVSYTPSGGNNGNTLFSYSHSLDISNTINIVSWVFGDVGNFYINEVSLNKVYIQIKIFFAVILIQILQLKKKIYIYIYIYFSYSTSV